MKFLFLLLFIALTNPSFAGNEGGHGGDGVLIDGRLYLLDLVEANVERNPFFDTTIIPREEDVLRLEESLPFDRSTLELVAAKVAEIRTLSPVLANAIMATVDLYQWRLVDFELVNIPDERTVLNVKMYQLAIRRNSSVIFSLKNWVQLDEANKAALILHEILYSFISIDVDYRVGNGTYRQNSDQARELNGYIFSRYFLRRGRRGLESVLRTAYHNILFKNRSLTYQEYLRRKEDYQISERAVEVSDRSGVIGTVHESDPVRSLDIAAEACKRGAKSITLVPSFTATSAMMETYLAEDRKNNYVSVQNYQIILPLSEVEVTPTAECSVKLESQIKSALVQAPN